MVTGVVVKVPIGTGRQVATMVTGEVRKVPIGTGRQAVIIVVGVNGKRIIGMKKEMRPGAVGTMGAAGRMDGWKAVE